MNLNFNGWNKFAKKSLDRLLWYILNTDDIDSFNPDFHIQTYSFGAILSLIQIN